MAVVPGFTFSEETEMISSLYSAIAFYKQYAQTSANNREYWMNKAEVSQQLADKFYNTCRDAIYNV
jgi:hypothetical protein